MFLVAGLAVLGCDLPRILDDIPGGEEISSDALLSGTVTASSTEAPGLEPGNAVDNNLSTRWSSQFSDPQWIQMDLGANKAIDRVTLRWESAFGAAYQLQTSNDGTQWTTVRDVTNGNGATDDFTALGAHGRFVRVFGTRRGTQWGYSLFELQVGAPVGGGGTGGSGGGGMGGSGGAGGGGDDCSRNDPLRTNNARTDAFDCTIVLLVNRYAFPDPMLVKAQVALESDFSQFAVSPDSPCGIPAGWTDAESKSFGLTQVTPACGESDATKLPNGHPNLTRDQNSPLWSTSVFNTMVNLDQGVKAIARFLAAVKQQHPDCTPKQYNLMAAGAYNSGEGSVFGCASMNARAQNYVNIVLGRYRNFTNAGGQPFPYDSP